MNEEITVPESSAEFWWPQAQQPFYKLRCCIALPAGAFPTCSQSLSVKILTDSRVQYFPGMAGKLPSPCLYMCRSVLWVWLILFKDTFCLPVSFLSCWDLCGAFAALVFSQPVFSACPFTCSLFCYFVHQPLKGVSFMSTKDSANLKVSSRITVKSIYWKTESSLVCGVMILLVRCTGIIRANSVELVKVKMQNGVAECLLSVVQIEKLLGEDLTQMLFREPCDKSCKVINPPVSQLFWERFQTKLNWDCTKLNFSILQDLFSW